MFRVAPALKHSLRLLALWGGCVLISATTARGDLDTDPYLFTDQPIAATGRFEWDEFDPAAGFAGPHLPDVAGAGAGAAEMTVTGIPQPMDGPPFGLVTSIQNLYTGGTIGHWEIGLSGLSTAEANSTVVLQLATLSPIDTGTLTLDGLAPTTLVERGVARAVRHDTDVSQAEFDTQYYWAEWQVPAASDYTLEFSGAGTHVSFAGARVDYFNSATAYSAIAAAAVPEPSAVALAGFGLGVAVMMVRRSLRASTHSN